MRGLASGSWLWRVRPGSAPAYGFATLLAIIASIIRWALGFLGDDIFVFAGYYPAVLFATYIGGAGVGAFATGLGALIGWWAFMPPHYSFFPITQAHEVKVLAYLFASALIIWGADSYRRLAGKYRVLAERLQVEENLRKLAVEELAHRLKNKIATIQSIISFQLRDNPQARDDIIGRLIALSATDDLILRAQGQGANIREIVAAELGPHDISRISMAGPDVLLPPKLALTIALLTHELATNAAKHGALSCEAGCLVVSWSLSGNGLSLEWRESNGPPVATPLHQGFGMKLLSRALDQFDGTVGVTFEPAGLTCQLRVALPEDTPNIVAGVTREAAE